MLAVGIVAHQKRAPQAHQLARTVNADYVSVDNGILGCEGNHRAVQAHLAGLPSTWALILEDDAQPVNGFLEQIEQALLMAPSPIVSCYIGKSRPPHWQKRIGAAIAEAQRTDANWILSSRLLHAVGYAIKTSLLPSLLTHESVRPVDEHITDWARRYGHLVSYVVPSLVDHQDEPTLIKHFDKQPRRPGRKAWLTGTRDHWTTKAVTLR